MLVSLLCTAVLALLGTAASAEHLRAGGTVSVLPLGTFAVSDGSNSDSVDLATAFGVSAIGEYDLSPNFSIGLAPRMVFGVKPAENADKSGKQLDLMVRGTGRYPVTPQLHAFGYVAPGYSFVFVPDNEGENPKGFALGLGAGVAYAISDKAFVTGELGYDLGFQAMKISGQSLDANFSYLHLGLGVGTTL